MACTHPPQDEAALAASRPLRLLERAARPARQPASPTPATRPANWTARLGRWVDRLLAA